MNRLLLAGACTLAALSIVPANSQTLVASGATSSFDGKWSVLILTEQGNCDRAYRYPLVIQSGNVLYGGKNNFTVSGRVEAAGDVVVNVSQGNMGAQGTGRLKGKYGAGTWTSPSGGCAGNWKADKRG